MNFYCALISDTFENKQKTQVPIAKNCFKLPKIIELMRNAKKISSTFKRITNKSTFNRCTVEVHPQYKQRYK